MKDSLVRLKAAQGIIYDKIVALSKLGSEHNHDIMALSAELRYLTHSIAEIEKETK